MSFFTREYASPVPLFPSVRTYVPLSPSERPSVRPSFPICPSVHCSSFRSLLCYNIFNSCFSWRRSFLLLCMWYSFIVTWLSCKGVNRLVIFYLICDPRLYKRHTAFCIIVVVPVHQKKILQRFSLKLTQLYVSFFNRSHYVCVIVCVFVCMSSSSQSIMCVCPQSIYYTSLSFVQV
jgi:hypothetical protein